MSRSTGARILELRLASATGIDVEVSWDRSAGSSGWQWHVFWADGPKVSSMRLHVEHACADLPDLDGDTVVFARTVRTGTAALAMVRNLRLGQPPLGRHASPWAFERELERADYPEQGIPDDQALAAVLNRLADQDPVAMPELLNRYGLAGLQSEVEPPDNVIPFPLGSRRPRPAQ